VVTGSGSRRRAASAVPSDAWQLLGSDGPTWHGEGRTAEVARRWEEGWGDASMGGAHGRAVAAACGRREVQEGEREVDERGPKRNFREK
jgi:hypothetical protein